LETPEAKRPGSRPRAQQVVRHLVLSIALWITYVLYWRVVLRRGVESEAAIALLLLGLFVILQILFTQAWILHNRMLARAHAGRRQARPMAPPALPTDFLGRRVEVVPAGTDLSTVPVVIIRSDETGKRYEAGIDLGGHRVGEA
jgi:hypothetical protein